MTHVFTAQQYEVLSVVIDELKVCYKPEYAKYFDAKVEAHKADSSKKMTPELRELMRCYCISPSIADVLKSSRYNTPKLVLDKLSSLRADNLGLYLHKPEQIEKAINLWLEKHMPRAVFIMACLAYIAEYDKSILFGRSHYERVKSVLAHITEHTSDDIFFKLIQQQYQLLEKQSASIVVGDTDAKHNQSVVRRMLTDKFTRAVNECYLALQAQLTAVAEAAILPLEESAAGCRV